MDSCFLRKSLKVQRCHLWIQSPLKSEERFPLISQSYSSDTQGTFFVFKGALKTEVAGNISGYTWADTIKPTSGRQAVIKDLFSTSAHGNKTSTHSKHRTSSVLRPFSVWGLSLAHSSEFQSLPCMLCHTICMATEQGNNFWTTDTPQVSSVFHHHQNTLNASAHGSWDCLVYWIRYW